MDLLLPAVRRVALRVLHVWLVHPVVAPAGAGGGVSLRLVFLRGEGLSLKVNGGSGSLIRIGHLYNGIAPGRKNGI